MTHQSPLDPEILSPAFSAGRPKAVIQKNRVYGGWNWVWESKIFEILKIRVFAILYYKYEPKNV